MAAGKSPGKKQPAKKQAAKKQAQRRSSDPVVLASYRLKQQIWSTVRIFVWGLVGAGLLLAAWPLASTIAGKQTQVDLKLSIVATVSLLGLEGATALWGRYQQKQAKILRQRNRDLVRRLEDYGVSLPEDDVV